MGRSPRLCRPDRRSALPPLLARSPPLSTRVLTLASGRVNRAVGLLRVALAAGHIHARQERHPDDEEGHHGDDAEAAGAGRQRNPPKDRWPQDTGELTTHGKEGKELRGLVPRDQTGIERAAEGLTAAYHSAGEDS